MNWLARFLRSTLGMKVVMAITGFILFGFVIVHMLGNLQIYLGEEQLNHYAEMLAGNPPLVWATRLILLGAVALHMFSVIRLVGLSHKARPVKYKTHKHRASSYASRTMRFGGVILLAFIIYHILHFTTGQAHPEFVKGEVYRNVIIGFSNPLIAGFYILANLALGLHLYHGVWSLTQTLGLNHDKYNRLRKQIASLVAGAVMAGNISIPVAVLTGMIS